MYTEGEGGETLHLPGYKLQHKLQTSSISNSIPQIILKGGMASTSEWKYSEAALLSFVCLWLQRERSLS